MIECNIDFDSIEGCAASYDELFPYKYGYGNLNSSSPKISNPKQLKVQLKEHQKTAVYAMLKMEQDGFIESFINCNYDDRRLYYGDIERTRMDFIVQGFNSYTNTNYNDKLVKIKTNYGILGDLVGSGKTLMIISLLLLSPIIEYKSCDLGRISIRKSKIFIKTNLIIVPHNVFSQWKEVLSSVPLKSYCINRKHMIEYLQNIYNCIDNKSCKRVFGFGKEQTLEYYDVILISATMLKDYCDKFTKVNYNRVIIDEAVIIKLPRNLVDTGKFHWFMSANPEMLRFKSTSYISQFLSPCLMSYYKTILKNNNDFVKGSLNLPKIRELVIMSYTDIIATEIKQFVSPNVMEMINAGNIQGAVSTLKCSTSSSSNLFDILKENSENVVHNLKAKLNYVENQHYNHSEQEQQNIINGINSRIHSEKTKLDSIINKISEIKNSSCPICMMEFDKPVLLKCCNNLFCIQCLCVNPNKICPLCRHPYNTKDFNVIDDDAKDDNGDNGDNVEDMQQLLTKKENVMNIIKNSGDKSILLFTSFDACNENISSMLFENQISHSTIGGSSIAIKNKIEKFDNGEIKVLILNSKNYGAGLNIQSADIVIIYNKMELSYQTQIIGRAQRLGRTTELCVFYIANNNEQYVTNAKTVNIHKNNKNIVTSFINNEN